MNDIGYQMGRLAEWLLVDPLRGVTFRAKMFEDQSARDITRDTRVMRPKHRVQLTRRPGAMPSMGLSFVLSEAIDLALSQWIVDERGKLPNTTDEDELNLKLMEAGICPSCKKHQKKCDCPF